MANESTGKKVSIREVLRVEKNGRLERRVHRADLARECIEFSQPVNGAHSVQPIARVSNTCEISRLSRRNRHESNPCKVTLWNLA